LIQQLRKGGIYALITGIVMLGASKFFFYAQFGNPDFGELSDVKFYFSGIEISIHVLLAKILVVIFLLLQAFWLTELVNRERIFERDNYLVFWFFLLASVLSWQQSYQLEPVLFHFVLFYVISRCLKLSDEELTKQNIYLDIGSVFGFGLLFFPLGIFYLPVILLTLNSFTRFDINRLLLLILGMVMIFLGVSVLSYILSDMSVIAQLREQFSVSDNLGNSIWNNPSSKAIFVWLLSIVCLAPLLLTQLGRSPVRQRKMMRVFWLIPAFGLPIFLFSGGASHAVTLMVIPIAMGWSFIGNRAKKLLWPNLILLATIWALFVLQWSYF